MKRTAYSIGYDELYAVLGLHGDHILSLSVDNSRRLLVIDVADKNADTEVSDGDQARDRQLTLTYSGVRW